MNLTELTPLPNSKQKLADEFLIRLRWIIRRTSGLKISERGANVKSYLTVATDLK